MRQFLLPALAAMALATTPAVAEDVGADEFRTWIEKAVTHDPGADVPLIFLYHANGTYESFSPAIMVDAGGYTVQADGQVCWDRSNGSITGCFRYYREGGELRVMNSTNGYDIGPVTVE